MHNKSDQSIILWFRNDLRLADNPALDYASSSLFPIIPIYIIDENIYVGESSKWWLHHSLDSLNKSLDSKLNFFIGNPQEIIDQLIRENNIYAVVWNRCYEPATIKRDTEIKTYLKSKNILVETFNSNLLPIANAVENNTLEAI